MVTYGDEIKEVGSQGVTLNQGGNEFRQLYNLAFTITRPSRKKARTDGVLDKLEGLGEHKLECDILLTVPELVILVSFTALVNNSLPVLPWNVVFTAKDGTTDTYGINAKLTTLVFQRQEMGSAIYHLVLETMETEV